MERFRGAINVAIVLLIAAAVFLLSGGGKAAGTFEALLMIGFGVGFAYFGLRMYREYRVTIHGFGDNYRAGLYGSLALAAFLVAGRERMWNTGLGELVWFALALLVIYGLMVTYRRWRSY
jgi:hypothetical protein